MTCNLTTAVVLVSVYPGRERQVAEKVAQLKELGVERAFSVFGEYDVVALVQSNSIESLSLTIGKKIRSIEGVKKTSTLIALDLD